MKNQWRNVKLGELLTRTGEIVELEAGNRYRQVTVKWWGQGATLRNEIQGYEVATSKMLKVSTGDLILSRIDARNGAIGIIPDYLNGAVVSTDFPIFSINTDIIILDFLSWVIKSKGFINLCRIASEGTTNRVRLKESRFLEETILLPEIEEQKQIAATLNKLAANITEVCKLQERVRIDQRRVLIAVFQRIRASAPRKPMSEVAPIIRRAVTIEKNKYYHELGIRSFGKGTFHKPTLSAAEVGSKRLFEIHPGDLLFSNVFAWEGAIAVANEMDQGRVGSHRFITCIPVEGITTANFLKFYFLTDEGLRKIGEASPGGAGRNRTLNLKSLEKIKVPVPSYEQQKEFDLLCYKVEELKKHQTEATTELDSLLPNLLDKAFNGSL